MASLAEGRYELEEIIGEGGMGRVWRARDTTLGRNVAVKEVIAPHGLSDEARGELYDRAAHEARNASRIEHPSLVTIYDVVTENGHPWMIMELLDTTTLQEYVKANGPLSQGEVIRLTKSLLNVLAAVHGADVIHRDIKPSNVTWNKDGQLRLLDFGIAKHAEDTALTGSGLIIGTPSYLAPECILLDTIGPESDLWSVGAVLYYALTGKPIFERSTSQALMHSIAYDNIPEPPIKGPLRSIVNGLLQKKANRRLTIDQVRSLLDRATEFARAETMTKPRQERRRQLSPATRRAIIASSTVCGVGALVLALGLSGVIGPNDNRATDKVVSSSSSTMSTTSSSNGHASASSSSASPSPSPSRSYWTSPNGEVYGDEDMSVTLGPGWKVKSTSEHDVTFTSPDGFRYVVEPLGIGNLREAAESKWKNVVAVSGGRTPITYSNDGDYAVWQYTTIAYCSLFPCPSGSVMRHTASIERQSNGKLVWTVLPGSPAPDSPSATYDQSQREKLASFGERVELTD